MLAGNRETSLGIEGELGHAAKDGERARWINSSLCHRDAPAGRSDSEYLLTWIAFDPVLLPEKTPLAPTFYHPTPL
jgi:hypothetical protein